MLVHNVFFTLHDGSTEEIARLIESCREHLAGHPGEVFFAVGGLEPELDRPVNDRDFHVALTVVFEDRAAHDAYQVEPRHLRFIESNKPTWAKVRVFDSID
jgi:quinol monooxygenase YgiN